MARKLQSAFTAVFVNKDPIRPDILVQDKLDATVRRTKSNGFTLLIYFMWTGEIMNLLVASTRIAKKKKKETVDVLKGTMRS